MTPWILAVRERSGDALGSKRYATSSTTKDSARTTFEGGAATRGGVVRWSGKCVVQRESGQFFPGQIRSLVTRPPHISSRDIDLSPGMAFCEK
jgi:hypothetical protein